MTATLDPPVPHVASLRCRECGTEYAPEARHVCDECFGPLAVAYAPRTVTRAEIEAGPYGMWRYAPFLPAAPRVDLGAGWTPLVRARNLERRLGLRELWVKDDSANPTHSFKDRVVSVAASRAVELGFTTLACASTGNLANSVAAHAARAGLRAVVLVPSDLEQAKIVTTAVYGSTVVAVDGAYDDVNRLCAEVADDLPWAFVNVNLRPYYAEGSKTVGYEIAEQLGWRLPGQVVLPVASGSLLTKVDTAFRDLVAHGLVEDAPYRVYGGQGAGCAPVATAFANGWDACRPVRASGIAKSLAIGNPADGPYALDVVRRSGGAVVDVPDDEVVGGIRLLAETEGIFGETAGGVTVGALVRLLRSGHLDPDAPTVVVNTGDGLKTIDAVAPVARPAVTIEPSRAAFLKAGLA
jgi:threonine synthase